MYYVYSLIINQLTYKSSKQISVEMCLLSFLEDKGIVVNGYNVIQAGSLFPFHDMFPRARRILPACVYEYEYFNKQDGYIFLPFKHGTVGVYVDEDVPDSLIWVCHYCSFWCEVFDLLIMERHLCGDCVEPHL
jgi:hypothetical protein